MDYFQILNLEKEPFSNSPDPDFFYQSHQHISCLQQLEIALRLRRGLNVVIGNVGAGKTTLCRQLIRGFAADECGESHLILDPHFRSSVEFLKAVAEMVSSFSPAKDADEWQLKETIKKTLFKKGLEENKIVVLIIDEGQKLPEFGLELLRELLNYETNTHKLLQIVIFAQTEFEQTIHQHAHFEDRINLYHFLKPLNFRDTCELIRYRLRRSSPAETPALSLFSLPALWMIYRATGGYPRKIINLCHRCLLAMIIQNRCKVGRRLVRSCAKRDVSHHRPAAYRIARIFSWSVVAVLAVLTVGLIWLGQSVDTNPFAITASASIAAKSEFALPSTKKIPPPQLNREKKTVTVSVESAVPAGEGFSEMQPEKISVPRSLGQLNVVAGEYLSSMIKCVYGQYNRAYLAKVLSANPNIDDPSRIRVGQWINFPSIPLDIRSGSPKWWVEVARTRDIKEAMQRCRDIAPLLSDVRMISYWLNDEGLQFSIIYAKSFRTYEDAGYRKDHLPQPLNEEASVVNLWHEHAVYFTNPNLLRLNS